MNVNFKGTEPTNTAAPEKKSSKAKYVAAGVAALGVAALAVAAKKGDVFHKISGQINKAKDVEGFGEKIKTVINKNNIQKGLNALKTGFAGIKDSAVDLFGKAKAKIGEIFHKVGKQAEEVVEETV